MAAGHRPAESMRVLVTGATGFVGSHTVGALVERGHDVRLFVRAPERVPIALETLGVSGRPYTVGDVTDPATVEAAMAGCDAVVHCGSAFSLNIRDGDTVRRTNVVGTEIVIDTAHRLGLDPIVHVSSFSALLPPNGRVLTTQSPVGNPRGAYFRSKADSDRIARRYQEAGAPVVITYPGTVDRTQRSSPRRGAVVAGGHPEGARAGNSDRRVSDRRRRQRRQGARGGDAPGSGRPPLHGDRKVHHGGRADPNARRGHGQAHPLRHGASPVYWRPSRGWRTCCSASSRCGCR